MAPRLAWALAASLGATLGCATVETAAAKALISPEQAKAIGDQVQEELKKQGVRFVSDATVDGWVTKVSEPLFVVARKARPDISVWRVHVIDDPKTVNAFATTGGDLYVYSGLVLLADDGAELAGVIGHEIGHVVLYHVQRQMVNAVGLEALIGVGLGKNPGAATQLAAALGGKAAMLANSRGDEKEADDWGVRHANEAGYDPTGIVRFFRKMGAQEGKTPVALSWLSSHPTTPSRVEDVERIIREKKLQATSKGPGGLDEVKDAIRRLPPAPAKQPSPGGASRAALE